jgi:serine phosphatase RsbU (regulator of sigma subunit)
LERLRGVLTALAQRRFAIRLHARELAGMHRLHQSLHRHFDEIDRELQLASRLQRDFLPRGVSRIGPIRFSTLYRPCTWVSGDIFDIIQLDDSHTGFYLADAIGHGVAAGLLTMYIKHAIKPRRISTAGCELIRPPEVMAMLNDQLAAQDLPTRNSSRVGMV